MGFAVYVSLRCPWHSLKVNRTAKRAGDFALCAGCNLIERFFNKLEHDCAIATRYDQSDRNVLAAVQLAVAVALLE